MSAGTSTGSNPRASRGRVERTERVATTGVWYPIGRSAAKRRPELTAVQSSCAIPAAAASKLARAEATAGRLGVEAGTFPAAWADGAAAVRRQQHEVADRCCSEST